MAVSTRSLVAIGIIAASVTQGHSVSAQPERAGLEIDLDAWQLANNICRGVSDPEVFDRACELRNQLGQRLTAAGLCGGEGGWRPCQLSESQEEAVPSDLELQAYIATAGGLLTVCQHGTTGLKGSSDAKSFCVGRLAGAATIMQYNCISLQAGVQTAQILTMGDFPNGEVLVEVFLDYMVANPQEEGTEWGFVALNVFSNAFPCQ